MIPFIVCYVLMLHSFIMAICPWVTKSVTKSLRHKMQQHIRKQLFSQLPSEYISATFVFFIQHVPLLMLDCSIPLLLLSNKTILSCDSIKV